MARDRGGRARRGQRARPGPARTPSASTPSPRRIKCPTCAGESVLVSQAASAQDIRDEIARQVARRAHRRRDPRLHRRAHRGAVPPHAVGQRASAALTWVLPVVALVARLRRPRLRLRPVAPAAGGAAPDDDDRALVAAALAAEHARAPRHRCPTPALDDGGIDEARPVKPSTSAGRRRDAEAPTGPARRPPTRTGWPSWRRSARFLLPFARRPRPRARRRRPRRRTTTRELRDGYTARAGRRAAGARAGQGGAGPPKPPTALGSHRGDRRRRRRGRGGRSPASRSPRSRASGCPARPVSGDIADSVNSRAGRGPVAAGHRSEGAIDALRRGAEGRPGQRRGAHLPRAGWSPASAPRPARPTWSTGARASSTGPSPCRPTYADPYCFKAIIEFRYRGDAAAAKAPGRHLPRRQPAPGGAGPGRGAPGRDRRRPRWRRDDGPGYNARSAVDHAGGRPPRWWAGLLRRRRRSPSPTCSTPASTTSCARRWPS